MLQDQLTAIGLNLSMIDQTAAPRLESHDALADQMLNVTNFKTPEEYDPEELYEPSIGL